MIRLLIVHPSRLVCETIAAILKDEKDIAIVGYATGKEAALSRVEDCNLMLVSTELPQNGAQELIQAAGALKPDVKTLVMGLLESDRSVLKYVEAGAAGYVFKKESAQALLRNLRAAHNNRAFVSPKMAALLMTRLTELVGFWPANGTQVADTFNLTPREREVLQLLEKGWSNRQIAEELVIEVGTVKNHVHNVLKKLELNSRRDVVHHMNGVEG